MFGLRILTKSDQKELLARLAANEIIFNHYVSRANKGVIEAFDKFIENDAEMAYLVGGFDGMERVRKAVYDKPTEHI